MKLEILEAQDVVLSSMELCNNIPSNEEITKLILYEDKEYKFRLIFDSESVSLALKEVVLYIDEKAIFLTKHRSSLNMWISDYNYHFRNHYDLTNFIVKVEDDFLFSSYFHIATNKQLSKNIERMIEDIEKMQSGLLEICFAKHSVTRRKSGLGDMRSEGSSIQTALDMYKRIILVLREQWPFFRSNSKVKIAQTVELNKMYNVNRVGLNEVNWIVKHPEFLKECEETSNIQYMDKHYYPEMLLSQKAVNTFDIYENRQILGFINSLIQATHDIKEYIMSDIIVKLESSLVKPSDIDSNYEIPSNFKVRYMILKYQKILYETKLLNNELQEMYILYNNIFNISGVVNLTQPKMTNTVLNIYHYRNVFDIMLIWWNDYKSLNMKGDSYLMRLRELSKIYEYYCLLRLIIGIKGIGYTINSDYIGDETKDELNTVYSFTNQILKTNITLFYNPIIYGNPNLNDKYKDLYVLKHRDAYLTPDYMIKFEKGNKILYGIFDAKHTYEHTAFVHKLPEEVVKYVHGIGTTLNLHSMLFMWLLFPDLKGSVEKTTQNTLPNYLVYPSIGVYSLSPDVTNNNLSNFLRRLHELFLCYPRTFK